MIKNFSGKFILKKATKIANGNGTVTSDMNIFFPNQNNRNMEFERKVFTFRK